MRRERVLMMEYAMILLAYGYLLDGNSIIGVALSLCAALCAVLSHSVKVFRKRYGRMIGLYLVVMCAVYMTPLPSLLNGLSGVLLGQCAFTTIWLVDSDKVLKPVVHRLELIFLSMTALLFTLTPRMIDWFYATDLKSFGAYLIFLVILFLFLPLAYRGKILGKAVKKALRREKQPVYRIPYGSPHISKSRI